MSSVASVSSPVPRPSPLMPVHHSAEALIAPYGPSNPAVSAIELVEAFDPVEIEYASIRRHAAIFDSPHRATLIITGTDRVAFLNRMLTQELKDFPPFTARRSFFLNRKGRIDADLRLLNLPDRIVADLDIFAAERARTELEKYIITEDAAIADATAHFHILSLHGPSAAALLARLSSPIAGAPIADIAAGAVSLIRIGDIETMVDRIDTAGEIGLELRVPVAAATAVYEAISTSWSARPASGAIAPSTDLARRIGWHALNIARIEAGTPLYNLDFGPDSLPHECGEAALHDRVSFRKGCYLGQEIVARMQSLGHPKQKLVGLRIDSPAPDAAPPQAVTGTPVVEADAPGAPIVGAVTSSCQSPMLAQAPIAFAMVKHSHATPGRKLWLQLDGSRLGATVDPNLAFLRSSLPEAS